MHLFKTKRVSNPKPSSSSPSSPPPSLLPPSLPSSSSTPSSSKRNSKSSKKNVTTISKLSKRTLSRTASARSSTSSSSSWSCHGAPPSSSQSSHNRDSVLFEWNGADPSSSKLQSQPGSGGIDEQLRSEANDSWWGRIEGEGGEEVIKDDGQDEHDGWATSQSGRMAFSPSGETSFSGEGRMEGSRSSSSKEAGSLARSSGREATSSIASSSPWSSSQGSSSLDSSLGAAPHPTSSSSLANSSSNSSNWISRGLRIDVEQLPPPPSPSTMSSVQSFIFPSFHSSSSSSSAAKPPPVTRHPSYHVDFEDEDPFACRPIQQERRTSHSTIPSTEPLHLSRQPQRPRITSVQSITSAQTSSPSSVYSSPTNPCHALPPLPRPPRSSSRPKAANPSVTRITRERSSSTASMSTSTSSHSSASPNASRHISRGPPQHPPPSRPPPPIPTTTPTFIAPSSSLDLSNSHSTTGSDSDAELDGVWEGFLKDVVGMKVRPGTSTIVEGGGSDDDGVPNGRKPWGEKPLPAMPIEEVRFSVALNPEDRGSAVSGLAYLDEDEADEIADQPFSLDASFTASDYYSTVRNNHLPTSSSLQSIMSLEISAFNFPTPPAHLPPPVASSTSIAPYHRPSHYSNLSTSSTMSSLSSLSNGSSVPITPSFPDSVRDNTFAAKIFHPVEHAEGGGENLWGTSGTISQSPGGWSGTSGEEEKRVQWSGEEDEDMTIAWRQRESRSGRASEDSVRSETEVAWGEAF